MAICAVTPAWAIRLARQAQDQGVARGAATDLGTLAGRAPTALWTLRWLSPYSPLEVVEEDVPEAEWLVSGRVHEVGAGVAGLPVDAYTRERSR